MGKKVCHSLRIQTDETRANNYSRWRLSNLQSGRDLVPNVTKGVLKSSTSRWKSRTSAGSGRNSSSKGRAQAVNCPKSPWCDDSGATHHVAGALFTDVQPCTFCDLTAITWKTPQNSTPWIFLRLAPGRRHSLTPLLPSVSLRYPTCSTPHLVSPQHTGFEHDALLRTLFWLM